MECRIRQVFIKKPFISHTPPPPLCNELEEGGGGNDKLKRKWDVYIFDIERTQLNTVNSKGVFAKRN